MMKYQDVVLAFDSGRLGYDNGTPVFRAQIRVLRQDDTEAQLYSDNGITPLRQPVLTDATGNFAFYVADGTYDIVTADPFGMEQSRKEDVQIVDTVALKATTGVIPEKAVSNDKLADMAAGTFKGAITPGAPADLTATAAKLLLALDQVDNKTANQITEFDRSKSYPPGVLAAKAMETLSVTDAPYFAFAGPLMDNTTAFRAAIAAAQLTGARMHIPQGVWRITDTLNITQTMQVSGAGRFSTVIAQRTANKGVFNITGDFCQLDRFSIIYELASGTIPASGATAIRNTGNFTTVDFIAVRSSYVGMDFQTGVGCAVTNVLIFDYEDIAFWARDLNDIFLSTFVFNAGNTTRGRRGGLRLEGKLEAYTITTGDILLGVTSHTTNVVTNGMNTRPAYNKISNVFFDSGRDAATFDRMVETDFVSCWWSGGRDNPSAGLIISECRSLRFTNCLWFNNGGHGVLHQPSCTDIKFVNCKAESNSATAGANVSHGFAFGAGSKQFSVIACTASNGLYLGTQGYGILIGTGCDDFHVADNNLLGNGIGPMADGSSATANKFVHGNLGYVTQGKGMATIPAGATSVVVPHGLSATLLLQDIALTRAGTSAGSIDLYADTITPSSFTIRTAPAPTSAVPIAWQARVAGA